MHILIVEDDPHVRTAMTRLLRQAGHEVVAAFTAEAAMGLLAKEQIDLVLLDIMLGDGGASGWSVAGFMQSRESLRKVPIIVVSAMDPEDIREGAKAYANLLAQAAIIVGKPVDADELLTMIERVCAKD